MTNITDHQRAAWAEVKDQAYDVAELLAPLLPSELTNPRPVLPTDPGLYGYGEGSSALRFLLTGLGRWYVLSDGGDLTECVREYITQAGQTLVKLVPDRPQITREQLDEASGGKLGVVSINRLFALVNGTERD